MDFKQLDILGIEDTGKWMPFIFHLDVVESAKLTSDDPNMPTYDCTTIFTRSGDAYIIDTPYTKFFELYKQFNADDIEDDSSSNLEL
jgi:hypothetical protein